MSAQVLIRLERADAVRLMEILNAALHAPVEKTARVPCAVQGPGLPSPPHTTDTAPVSVVAARDPLFHPPTLPVASSVAASSAPAQKPRAMQWFGATRRLGSKAAALPDSKEAMRALAARLSEGVAVTQVEPGYAYGAETLAVSAVGTRAVSRLEGAR